MTAQLVPLPQPRPQIDPDTPVFSDVDDLHDANCIEPTVPVDATKITQKKGSVEEFSVAARKR
jgi:hypothetical protein